MNQPIDPSHKSHRAIAARVLEAEAEAVGNIVKHLDEAFDAAVELIAACDGSVILSGVGKSGLVGQKISATLASLGTPSHFLHPTEAMHGDLGRIRSGDIVILLSRGGESEEVISLAALLQQDGIVVIGITARRESHLARLSTLHLYLGDLQEACPHNLAPTASTTATLAMGDALALAISEHRAFSAEDYRKRHPGGLLGRQMMPVTEALRFRAGENLPLIRDDLTVAETLRQAAKNRRAGAVLLIDEAGRLSGVFTDADFRRLMLSDGTAAMEKPIADVMTRSPKRLLDTDAVRDAVQLIREVRLDEIPVVDAEGRPVGLIDVQDLIALKVVEPR